MTKSSDSERLRVMIVDDHALFRRGLEMVLGEEEDLERQRVSQAEPVLDKPFLGRVIDDPVSG